MIKRQGKLILQVVFIVQLLLCQGCNIFGFLAHPSAFEQKLAPECELKKIITQKMLVWVESMPGSGAGTEIADSLHESIRKRLVERAGISKKNILVENPSKMTYNPFQKPEEIGRRAGAGFILYIRLETFEIINLHSDKIYSGQMRARAFFINCENGEVLCPKDESGIIADVATEMVTEGRKKAISALTDAAAHCIVRNFYHCPSYEYKVNEERSTMNEMIREDVY